MSASKPSITTLVIDPGCCNMSDSFFFVMIPAEIESQQYVMHLHLYIYLILIHLSSNFSLPMQCHVRFELGSSFIPRLVVSEMLQLKHCTIETLQLKRCNWSRFFFKKGKDSCLISHSILLRRGACPSSSFNNQMLLSSSCTPLLLVWTAYFTLKYTENIWEYLTDPVRICPPPLPTLLVILNSTLDITIDSFYQILESKGISENLIQLQRIWKNPKAFKRLIYGLLLSFISDTSL